MYLKGKKRYNVFLALFDIVYWNLQPEIVLIFLLCKWWGKSQESSPTIDCRFVYFVRVVELVAVDEHTCTGVIIHKVSSLNVVQCINFEWSF